MLIKDAARVAANDTLAKYWPEELLPVDCIAIAQRMGLKVWIADMDYQTSGFIVQDKGRPAQIYINRNHAEVRQRFTCAHELGHYVERRTKPGAPDEEYTFVDHRHQNRGNDTRIDPHEFYADEFAGNLLMPAREVDEFMDGRRTVDELAEHFDVSLEAANIRLKRLGLA